MKNLVVIKKSKLSGRYFALSPTPFGKRATPLGVKTRTEAETIVADGGFEEAARLGAVTDKAAAIHMAQMLIGRKVTVSQAIAEWELCIEASHCYAPATAAGYMIAVRKWASEHNLGGRMIYEIKAEHIAPFINGKGGDQKVPTLRGRLAALNGFLGWCLRKRYTLYNPAFEIRRVQTRGMPIERREKRARQVFTVEEEMKLLAECDRQIALVQAERDGLKSTLASANQRRRELDADASRWLFWKFAIIVGMHVGLRIGDIATLEWGQIKDCHLICWTRKRDKRVEVPLDQPTKDILAQVQRQHPRWLFPDQAEAENDPRRRHALAMQFIRLRKLCGIEGKQFHDTRSTYVSRLIASGVPIEKAKHMVGHVSVETTKGYVVEERGNDQAHHTAAGGTGGAQKGQSK